MKGRISRTLIIILWALGSSAAQEKKVPFDSQAALDYIKDLASDAMLGRKSGRPGGVMAEDYVASRLKDWGVEPGGENGTYFQTFTFPQNHIAPGIMLEILSAGGNRLFEVEDGWRIWPYSGSGDFTAEIVFAGYGVRAPEKGYDDWAGTSLKDKLAFILLETPPNLADRLQESADLGRRVKTLQDAGARGIIFMSLPDGGRRILRGALDPSVYRPDFVILRGENKLADFIFKDLPADWNDLVEKMDAASRPHPYETGVRARVKVQAFFDPRRPARNVLGVIEGRDHKLKDEVIMIAAHIDHLGLDPQGEVMNGANDNASGTAVAMEVARVLCSGEPKPKRTVVFFLWSAEEQGFYGLKHYVEHPLFPIEKTVVYLNMDMVGHGNGSIRLSGHHHRPDLWKRLQKNIAPSVLEYVVAPEAFSPRVPPWEDLMTTGIARFGLQTDGRHLKFHTSRDDVDLIRPELLKRTGDFILAAVEALGNSSENLIPPFRREDYYLKCVRLVDFHPAALSEIAALPDRWTESPAALQLALLEGGNGLRGDALSVKLIKELQHASRRINSDKGLALFSSAAALETAIRQRRLTVLPGLKGSSAVRDDPDWLEFLAEQGLRFVWEQEPDRLFQGDDLNDDARTLLRAVQSRGLLLVLSGLDSPRAKSLLRETPKPVLLLAEDLFDKDTLELIKKTHSALGLLLGREETAEYARKLEAAHEALDSNQVMIVNETSILGEGGKDGLLRVMARILKANTGWPDILNLFSGTFLRVLEAAR